MLDQETKRKIDNARDILVGKVPDPKSQIEQITIAMMYKFMDDMDMQAEEWGGKASFFIKGYKKYSWSKIFNPKLGGFELMELYGDAITRMNQNPNIPQLFRDIFKNAYLPYRSPETLKSFLKQIDEFSYDNSERLGDAFEYLLSIMSAQGDAGQFRTPRHIIDFIVSVVDPKKNDTIADPACGTSGFLISSFKHILMENREKTNGDRLTPAERKRLLKTITGYDISPDMVRLSLVNMYLHGFSDPKIHEYDTLTSEDRWDETYDVMLANPPFMTPKGGIRPHKRFSIKAKRSEVLFVDYIAEHLNPNGRAGIIVPEGIIFQSQKAYKDLRKMLVENYLYAVVSLPAGVFSPYSGVKTSILLMDRAVAKKTDKILFVKVENDGFSLGAQRTTIEGTELPRAEDFIQKYKASILNSSKIKSTDYAHVVKKSKIAESSDFNLSGDRYKSVALVNTEYQMFKLDELFEIQRGGSPRPIKDYITDASNGINWIKIGDAKEGSKYITDTKEKIKPEGMSKSRLVEPGDFILSNSMSFGRPYILKTTGCIHDGWLVFKQKSNNLDKDYIFYVLSSNNVKLQFENSATGGVVKNLNINLVRKVQIPLPPIEVQKEIVAEIEGYQKIIDGARLVVENYKPTIKIDPDWKMVELGEIISVDGVLYHNLSKHSKNIYIGGDNITPNTGELINLTTIKEKGIKGPAYGFKPNQILYSKLRPYLNKATIIDFEGFCSSDMYPLTVDKSKANINFVLFYILSTNFLMSIKSFYERARMPKINKKQLYSVRIPLPKKSIQKSIVSQIEKEQELVNANKELISIFERKIKDKIAEVW